MNIATGPQRPGQHGRVERMNARKTASIPKCTRSEIKECQGRTAKFSQKCMEVRESQTHGTSTRMSQIAILFIISRLIVRKEPLFTPPNCTFSGKRRDQVDAFLFLAFRRDQGSSASLLLKFFPAKGHHVWPATIGWATWSAAVVPRIVPWNLGRPSASYSALRGAR
jgi:hypothetical protein